MLRDKRHPRIMNPVRESRPSNFFYRLVSSQRFLAIIGLAFIVAILLPLARTYSQKKLVEKEIEEIKSQISLYENQNRELSELLSYLQSDQSLEEQARQNLNLKKPGEVVVVIENKKTAFAAVSDNQASSGASNLEKWWGYFFN